MAKKPTSPAEPNYETYEHWQCEGCKLFSFGESPPDRCPTCGHEYFENLADQLACLPTKH